MSRIVLLTFWMNLLVGCVTSQQILLESIPSTPVPFYLDTEKISGQAGGRWILNGDEYHPNAEGQILITQSGEYQIEYRYYKRGKVLQSFSTFNALPPRDYCSKAIITPKGTMVVKLSDQTLRHSNHFEELININYYDSLIFHRIVPGFVIQGGNAQETPFQRTCDVMETKELEREVKEDLLHYRGALAMARMPDQVNPEKRSSPDQFYLVQGTQFDEERWEQFLTDQGRVYMSYQEDRYLAEGGAPQLDGEYTVFGYLTHGFDVLDSLSMVITSGEKPVDPVWMIIQNVE